jgi:hypothetical protein
MKSAFSSIWSSVMPMASSSFSSGFHDGSVVSMAESRELDGFIKLGCDGDGDATLTLVGGIMD